MSDLINAREAASLAIQFDQMGETDKAVECYRTAARILDRARDSVSLERRSEIREKVQEYLKRANALQEQKDVAQQAEVERSLQQCYFLMQQALDADEADLKDIALQLYTQAVELAVTIKSSDPEIKEKVKGLASQALDRAEDLKGINKFSTLSIGGQPRPVVSPNRPPLQREQSVHLQVSGGKHTYTEEEKDVLRTTSNINNNWFLPFMDVDLSEKFQYAIPFEEKASELKLSSKQQKEFDCWIRPHEICSDPKLIINEHVDCFSIKQTIVSDCSFVASLAVSALYERRFNKKIITSIIYPKNKNKQPVYNPFGKYMVKLHLNGVRRKVIIDDRLPYSKYGRLLCSYSSNKNEFWVSMLEKAYMKVMGGYDFPGSNSNIDLHALTGWIPERCAIRKDEPDFNADALYETIRSRMERGDVLVTVATGPLSDPDAERTGLVATHAYAVLDVKIANGVKLLKLKNPWSHLRWRGNYSELDTVHWTPNLRGLLNYDPESAAQYDNGVFWIDYTSILEFFDVFYLNWNPELFKFTYCIHQKWDAGNGPAKDAYIIGENPQFSLHVQGKGAVWLLLTRHITQIDDFRDNKEYITLLVYKNNGKRVYYPCEPPPYIDGIRINSPHYLCKVIVGEGSSDRYTLVVSQYEKTRTIFYTLRAYATCPFSLNKMEPYRHFKSLKGDWTARTAGGCENNRQTYPNNPKFVVTVPDTRVPCHVVIELRGPKQYQMGMDVRVESLDDPNVTAPFFKETSGPYRSGFVVLELNNLPAGRYIVTPSTFYAGQEGPFFLQFRSTCELQCEARN
ncbi:calpain-7-like isoform X4 [Ostrinia furnacalis]|uniref:calpain-7-like isoform X3 n=2 Tax=Ostrinia furnacalis TaxID=93504 RepID=UPI001038D395|nr:calpain-7-like isoform X3 [Ostrinia furnacalis]XP_028163573.1 calpain-7-like isoform X4 [Ostrinia furnacalis]